MRHARLATYAVAVSMIGLFAMPHPANAQDDTKTQTKLDLAAARANKKALVGQNMNLTDAQAKTFWPLYDAYEAKMDKIEDRHAAEVNSFVKTFQAMSDEQANKKLNEVIEIRQERLNVQKEFIPKFHAAISGVQTTRFFQIDNKLEALTQCALAQALPLVQGKDEGQKQ